MEDNRKLQLVQKADMALGDLAPGGLFNAQQAAKFFRVATQANVLSSKVTTKMMPRNILEQPKITWTDRVLYPGSSSQALPIAYRSKPSFSKVTITASLFRGQVVFPEEMLEDQIELGSFDKTLMAMAQTQIGGDIEDILISGDTASTDPTLAVLDGVLKLITTNTVNASAATLSTTVLKNTKDAMPSAYRSIGKLLFMTSEQAVSDYEATQEGRATPAGDSAIQNGAVLKYRRKEILEVPRFPENLGGPSNQTNMVYGDPKGIWLGFQRKLQVHGVYRPESGTYEIIFNVRMGVQIEHEPMFVRTYGITAA